VSSTSYFLPMLDDTKVAEWLRCIMERLDKLEQSSVKPETWRDVTAECEIENGSAYHHFECVMANVQGYRLRRVPVILAENAAVKFTGAKPPMTVQDAFIIERKGP
jgi:hypothetical protein